MSEPDIENQDEPEDLDHPEGQPTAKVSDEEKNNQQARLRAIQRAWDEAIERRTASEDSVLSGDSDEQARRRYYRIGVERLLLELESLGERTESSELWQSTTLGVVEIPLPERIRKAVKDPQVRVPWGVDQPEAKRIPIDGLSAILDIPWPLTVEFTLPVGQSEEIRDTATREPPIQVLDNAMRVARKFLGETGLDIEVSEAEHRAVVDEELLEEIEQWRKQNLQ